MRRLVLVLVLLAAFTVSALPSPAHADLYVVQSWTVTGPLPEAICYDYPRDHIWISVPYVSPSFIDEYTRMGDPVGWFFTTLLDIRTPAGLEFHEATENMWVVDSDPPREVVRLDRDHEVVNRFSIDSYVNSAYGIAFNTDDGHLYVCDCVGYKITEWTTGGFYKGVWIDLPFQPHGICYLSNEGTFLVSNNNNHKIYKLTASGLISHIYDMDALLGIIGLRGLTYDRLAGTVFVVAWDQTVYEIAGFTAYTGVDEPTETETSWSAIKALYR